MTGSTRTWLGIGLFLPLAGVMLAMFACLPAPIGDPATAKIDAELVGGWISIKEGNEKAVALVRQWDEHTYFVQYMATESKDGKQQVKKMQFKSWLADIGGVRFLVNEPVDDLRYVPGEGGKDEIYWAAMRLEKTASGLEIQMLDPGNDLLKGKQTREEIEAVLKTHAKDKALYGSGEALGFRKATALDRKMIEDLAKKFVEAESAGGLP